jgi:isochorismate hydrolase
MESYVTPESLEARAQLWLEQIAPINQHQMELSKERAALLIIDMQRFFLNPASPTFTCG